MRWIVATMVLSASFASRANADDWPMWRYDAARSNASPHAIPDKLQLQWVRQFPQPRPAWPASQTKLQFDAAYQPIVADKLMIVGSTVNDSVSAYDTNTGEQVWQFFTDGPVRFAPVAHLGRLFIASDDGYVYCLDVRTAKLLWKRNGGPTDRRIIGNDRLVSSWPVRGGPVVADNNVYFTASIWPFMGVFIHALDAQTGKTIWMNSETGSRWVTHPHGAPSFGSIVPQGYLAATADHLIVPGGRSLPAILDRGTGELQHFQFGGKGSGGWSVAANDQIYAVGGTLLDLQDGSDLGSRTAEVLGPDLLISRMTAWSLGKAGISETKVKDRRGKEVTKRQWKPGESWQVGDGDWQVLAMAGDRVYAGRQGKVACFDVNAARQAKSARSPVWLAEIEGRPVSIVAGDDRLFVVADDAEIYCFGEEDRQPKTFSLSRTGSLSRPNPSGRDIGPNLQSRERWSEVVRSILSHDGVDSGYAVAWGVRSGGLIEELLSQTSLHVIAIDNDSEKVDRLRRRWDAAGLYGTRVVAHVGDPRTFNLPPYLANLIFSEEPLVTKKEGLSGFVMSICKPLRPYGGTAIWPATPEQHDWLSEAILEPKLENADVGWIDQLSYVKRAGALPGSGDWTHQYADAANSVVSKDSLVKAPLGLLWFGGPSNDKVLPRHGHGPSPQVAGGRLVIEGANMLRCVDVYTGRVLWERELPGLGTYYDTTAHFPGAGEIGSNYVTLEDAVYVVYGDAILELSPVTGKTEREFKLHPDANSPHPTWGFIAVDDDLLVATSSPVTVGGQSTAAKRTTSLPKDMTPLIKPGAKWKYLTGSDPPTDWNTIGFESDSKWKTGEAGFGYGDGDDRTVLKVKGKHTRVYIRKTFDGKDTMDAARMTLAVNYDDAFIAWLNGKEIVRAGVGEGVGPKARRISSHEARGHELFEIKNFRSLLSPGTNVIALEGHNTSVTSSDFSLAPIILIKSRNGTDDATKPVSKNTNDRSFSNSLTASRYSSASRRLVAFERASGKKLWERTAEFNFRHNAIAIADGIVFCLDRMSDAKLQALKRRGVEHPGAPKLLALDGQSGDLVWSTEKDVFGTFLNYSTEHGVLLQAGSQYRDRARDEVGRGMVAYDGKSGKVLWKNLDQSYGGPCLLWKDKIITNGGGGFRLDLLTGKASDWKYTRMYGCNTAVGSRHLLTFRSGAAGYCDLTGDSGTGNIGGFRSSCTANLIVANGVLNAPDYTRTCNCAYQNQSSLALIHMPEAEMWTFSSLRSPPQHFGVNLGAAGDRRDRAGTIWYELPNVGGKSPSLPVAVHGKSLRTVRHHSSIIDSSKQSPAWIASSCVTGIESIEQQIAGPKKRWVVRLHFAELENKRPGQRVFDVLVQGKQVLRNFDIARETNNRSHGVTKEFAVEASGQIEVRFVAKAGQPCLNGIEVLARQTSSSAP